MSIKEKYEINKVLYLFQVGQRKRGKKPYQRNMHHKSSALSWGAT